MPPAAKRRRSVSEDSADASVKTESSKSSDLNGSRKKARKTDEESEDQDQEDYEDLELGEPDASESTQSSLPRLSRPMEIAESGTIARVELVNFMCHKYLKVDLGPKINFVIGHNGSGKSAILTAITIALGAKATSTNRAKKLSSLIREGANAALVVVHLTNRGPDAYRHDVYGDIIQVERRLVRDSGLGQYKIKNASGKLVSTKREELTAICDHMSIQVDNPLTVLSQDNARQFLNASSSYEKYKLFMRGTQLAQLAADYDLVRESIDTTKAIIERKSKFLPDLHRRAKEAEEKYKQMLAMKEIDTRIDDLNNELVWSQIIGKEREVEAARRDVEKAQEQLQSTREKINASRGKIENFDREIREIQAQIDQYKQSFQPSLEEKARIECEKLAEESKLNNVLTDIKEINGRVKQAKAQLVSIEKKIQEEAAKREASSQSKRSTLEANIEDLENKKKEKEQRIQELGADQELVANEANEVEKKVRAIEQEMKDLEYNANKLKTRIGELRAQKSNRLRAFGNRIPEVLRDIEAEKRWRNRKPVGPIGRFLRLKYEEYTEVLEATLNYVLNAFVVESHHDRRLLLEILRRHDLDRTSIIICDYQLFDYSSGEPDEQYLTVLRALEFDDEWVKRQLIISHSIEKTVLVRERAEGNRIMYERPRNVKYCYSADLVNVTSHQGMRAEVIQRYRGPPRLKSDVEPEIRETEQKIREARDQWHSLQQEREEMKTKLNQLRSKSTSLREILRQYDKDVRGYSFEISRAREALKEEEPLGIQGYYDEKERIEEKIKTMVGQFSELRKQQEEIRGKLQEIIEQLHRFEGEEEARAMKLDQFQGEIRNLEGLKQRERQTMEGHQRRLEERVERLKELQSTLRRLELTCHDWTRQAMQEFPERVETTETPEQLQRKINHLEKLREEKEKATGASLEEVEQEAKDALYAWNDAHNTIRLMKSLTKNMEKTLWARMKKWDSFRMYISLAAMGHFTYYMHKRGDNGQLKFSHKKEKLEIRVSTGDQFRKGTRHKDSKSLSGGEKSFSQVSLLLALWQGIASPIVCLDEFDVYMDAVNRKQSMKMMMESACENSSQYILITPQDASNMKPGPYVTIHRLADPERRTQEQ